MISFKELAGARIRAKREKAGYATQADLASAMEVDRARVSDWETGKVEPKGEHRATLLRLISATEEEIFGVPEPFIDDQSAAPTVGQAQIAVEIAEQVRKTLAPIEASIRDLVSTSQTPKPHGDDIARTEDERLLLSNYRRASPKRRKAILAASTPVKHMKVRARGEGS